MLSFNRSRWWAKSSCHSRVIHFSTTDTNAISYMKTGTGSFASGTYPITIPAGTYSLLPGHTAYLPQAGNYVFYNQGQQAMTEFVRQVDSR